MRFIFYSPDAQFERWDWRNPDTQGIGGSETSHIEMAHRLKRRGHEVISYNGIPEDCPGEWDGIPWLDTEKADYHHTGIWVFYRCPRVIELLDKMPGQVWWLILQDWDYVDADWKTVAQKADRVWALCQSQKEMLLGLCPELEPKLCVTSNGIKVDMIEEVEATVTERRDPFRVMFTSSPDRGLLVLASIFKRAREFEPRLNLHVFYGFDNIDKVIARNDKVSEYAKMMKDRVLEALKQPNVTWHGRIPQRELARNWLQTGIWCYPCIFHETSCITTMEAQAMGAIPVITPVYAQGENTHHGIAIDGDVEHDVFVQVRFAAELARLASNEILQQKIRSAMMADARNRFDWEVFVDQWIEAAMVDVGATEATLTGVQNG